MPTCGELGRGGGTVWWEDVTGDKEQVGTAEIDGGGGRGGGEK